MSTMPSVGSSTYSPGPNMVCSPEQEKVGTGSIEAIICPVSGDLRIRATVSQKMPITALIAIPANINPGLNAARVITMTSLLGNPRGDFTNDCLPVTNPGLRNLISTEDVGPFRVTGLAPAVS